MGEVAGRSGAGKDGNAERSTFKLKERDVDKRRREAFTLMEMMVVIGMLGVLMGVTFSGVGQAQRRARVAKANAEVRELVNAILAYEAAEESLPVTPDPVDATDAALADLLGNSGGPVYLNVPMSGGKFLDPWGTPYRFRIGLEQESGDMENFSATVTFPNRQRNLRW